MPGTALVSVITISVVTSMVVFTVVTIPVATTASIAFVIALVSLLFRCQLFLEIFEAHNVCMVYSCR